MKMMDPNRARPSPMLINRINDIPSRAENIKTIPRMIVVEIRSFLTPEKKPSRISPCIQKAATRELMMNVLGDEILASDGKIESIIKDHKKLRLLNTGNFNLNRKKRVNKAIRIINDGLQREVNE